VSRNCVQPELLEKLMLSPHSEIWNYSEARQHNTDQDTDNELISLDLQEQPTTNSKMSITYRDGLSGTLSGLTGTLKIGSCGGAV
jgi:hypothetical protein